MQAETWDLDEDERAHLRTVEQLRARALSRAAELEAEAASERREAEVALAGFLRAVTRRRGLEPKQVEGAKVCPSVQARLVPGPFCPCCGGATHAPDCEYASAKRAQAQSPDSTVRTA